MTYYLFRPQSLVTARVCAVWETTYQHMCTTPGPKHITIWCAIPPGTWNLKDVTVAQMPVSSGVVISA